MKTLEQKSGWNNRHIDPLPEYPCNIKFLEKNNTENLGHWSPEIKIAGLVGTVRLVGGPFKGIGFHAWEGHDSEFVYWKKISL